MRHPATLVTLVLTVLVAAACKDRERVDKQPEQFANAGMVPADSTAFTPSETDSFHQRSRVESARKRVPCNTGLLEKLPPIIAENTLEALDAINKEGLSRFTIDEVKFTPFDFPAFPFDYEQDIPALRKLAADHGLDRIVTLDMNELDRVRALAIYTYNFLSGGTVPENWIRSTSPSANRITRLRRDEGIGGTAEHYAALLCQLAMSIGITSRVVGMHMVNEDGSISTNAVCEVFINSLDKWVAFDPHAGAVYYLGNGVPLSAYELRLLMIEGLYHDIKPVIGAGSLSDIIAIREGLLPRYRYLYLWRMNNLLSADGGTPVTWQELFVPHLVWEDGFSLVRDGAFDRVPAFTDDGDQRNPLHGVRFIAHNRGDFEWQMNHVRVHLIRNGEKYVRVYADANCPNFGHIEFSDPANNNLTNSPNNMIDIDLVWYSALETRAVNVFGVKGPMCYIMFSRTEVIKK